MKKIIHIAAIIITTSLPVFVAAQPLYKYSQFELPKKFDSSTTFEVEETYAGDLIMVFLPKNIENTPPPYVCPLPIQRLRNSVKCKEEAEIPLRKKIDSIVDHSSYALLCPQWDRSEKLMIGVIVDAGFEALWNKPNDDCIYMIYRTGRDGLSHSSFIALYYDHSANEGRLASTPEAEELFLMVSKAVKEYNDTR